MTARYLIAALVLLATNAMAQTPSGEGDPDAVSCRPPQILPGTRRHGPEVCKTNRIWAQYRKDGMDVAADGVHDVRSEKWRSTNPMACRAATAGGSSISTANQTNFSMICD